MTSTRGSIAISLLLGIAACKEIPRAKSPEPSRPREIDPDQCEMPEAAEAAEALWNESVRDSLDLSIKIMDDIIEAWEAESFNLCLDELKSSWLSSKESACRDHYFEERTTAARYDEQTACFDDVLSQAREVIALMKAGDRAALDACQDLAGALEACRWTEGRARSMD
jgi:hypothetical protein